MMGDVPCIRGLRVPVAMVVRMVAERMTTEQILQAYPYLQRADMPGGFDYAAASLPIASREQAPGGR